MPFNHEGIVLDAFLRQVEVSEGVSEQDASDDGRCGRSHSASEWDLVVDLDRDVRGGEGQPVREEDVERDAGDQVLVRVGRGVGGAFAVVREGDLAFRFGARGERDAEGQVSREGESEDVETGADVGGGSGHVDGPLWVRRGWSTPGRGRRLPRSSRSATHAALACSWCGVKHGSKMRVGSQIKGSLRGWIVSGSFSRAKGRGLTRRKGRGSGLRSRAKQVSSSAFYTLVAYPSSLAAGSVGSLRTSCSAIESKTTRAFPWTFPLLQRTVGVVHVGVDSRTKQRVSSPGRTAEQTTAGSTGGRRSREPELLLVRHCPVSARDSVKDRALVVLTVYALAACLAYYGPS